MKSVGFILSEHEIVTFTSTVGLGPIVTAISNCPSIRGYGVHCSHWRNGEKCCGCGIGKNRDED